MPLEGLLGYGSPNEFADVIENEILDASRLAPRAALVRSVAESYSWGAVAADYVERFKETYPAGSHSARAAWKG